MQQEQDPSLTSEQLERARKADPVDAATVQQQQAEAALDISRMPLVSYVRSGGQTGADRGGLDAARAAGIPICGWCPPGGFAEDLPEPPGLLAMYPELREGEAPGYVERTALNVRDSHATLIVSPGGLEPLSGTEMTARFAKEFGRPVLVVDDPRLSSGIVRNLRDRDAGSDDSGDDFVEAAAGRVLAWLRGLGQRGITLNVAGPRESKQPGVYELTRRIVAAVLTGASLGHAS